MKRWPTFTLRYLLLVVLWWALALGLTREYLTSDEDYNYRVRCFLLSAVAWGGAYGGLALKMRFGLCAGLTAAAALLCFLIWAEAHDF
jgi:uncharacterized membrane protein